MEKKLLNLLTDSKICEVVRFIQKSICEIRCFFRFWSNSKKKLMILFSKNISYPNFSRIKFESYKSDACIRFSGCLQAGPTNSYHYFTIYTRSL